MRGSVAVVAAQFLLVAVVAGCSNDQNGAQDDALDLFLSKYVETLCARGGECTFPYADLADEGFCRQAVREILEQALFSRNERLLYVRAFVKEGTMRLNPEHFDECFAAQALLRCGQIDPIFRNECNAAIDGVVPRGGPCRDDLECAQDGYCIFADGHCPGVCTGGSDDSGIYAPEPDVGRSCTDSDYCQSGRCSRPSGTELVCGDFAQLGEECGDGRWEPPRCAPGVVCAGYDPFVPPAMRTPGICRTWAEVEVAREGEPCGEMTWCVDGLSCVQNPDGTRSCSGPSGTGQPCRSGLPDPCPDSDYCDALPREGRYDGTCRPLPREGEPCAETEYTPGVSRRDCAHGFVCVVGTCRELKREGESCLDSGQCQTLNCAVGRCGPPELCYSERF